MKSILGHSLIKKFEIKALMGITNYLDMIAKIQSVFEDEKQEIEDDAVVVKYPSYSVNDFLREVFISENDYIA